MSDVIPFPMRGEPGAELSDECAFICGYSAAQKQVHLEDRIVRFVESHEWSDDYECIGDDKEKLNRIMDATRKVKRPAWHAGYWAYFRGEPPPQIDGDTTATPRQTKSA
jgi:hypothetical protein